MAGRAPLTGNRPATDRDRRAFLRGSLGLGLTLGLGGLPGFELFADGGEAPDADLWRGGVKLGDLPFQGAPAEPLGRRAAGGLDARLYFDLARLDPGRMITPAEEFFVRTAAPDGLDPARPWRIAIGGKVRAPAVLSPEDLEPAVADQGVHLLECAGNTRFTRFGLMSAARWSGVALGAVLERAGPLPGATSVRVTGFDEHSRGSTNSTAGCSWVFTRDQLAAAGAFLATGMNGRPLPRDHGFPARLLVPGWYGCCCVKWVTDVELVDGRQPATSQMREFALRTHQDGVPEQAADYRPAVLDRAAMPIRVERWRLGGEVRHRVVGLAWGGDPSRGKLRIRFRPDAPFEPVRYPPRPESPTTWALWYHPWSPAPGRYLVQLEVDDPAVRTRRLDGGFYVRGVEVPAA